MSNHACRVGAILIALAPSYAAAQVERSQLKDVPVAQLKLLYLACDRASNEGRLASSSIAQCSVIYEELKDRAFQGDFEKLTAWAKSESAAQRTAPRH